MMDVFTVCNGHAELCDKSYGNVTFVGAHDSCEMLYTWRRRERRGREAAASSFRHRVSSPDFSLLCPLFHLPDAVGTTNIAANQDHNVTQQLVRSSSRSSSSPLDLRRSSLTRLFSPFPTSSARLRFTLGRTVLHRTDRWYPNASSSSSQRFDWDPSLPFVRSTSFFLSRS